MSQRRVAIIAGGRTPFVKSGRDFADLSPMRLATRAVSELVARTSVDPEAIDALALGVVLPEPGKPNLAREVVFDAGLPNSIEAATISSYCISGLRAVTTIAEAIETGRIDVGIAGGAEWLSGARDRSFFQEPRTGLSMGEHMEITVRDWELDRERQDEIALASHRNAIAALERLSEEIYPLAGVERDTGPRADTSLEALAALEPAFDPKGTLTAGNSSPITDGASAVLLMSEERASSEGLEPLAFFRTSEYGAIKIDEGLLMAPAVVVPRLLRRAGLGLERFDLIEMHEAFAAQIQANIRAWERGWKGDPTGPVDISRLNVNGSSIALGHPWAATGGRIVTSLAREMSRRDASLGLISICAAGAMAGAAVLERS